MDDIISKCKTFLQTNISKMWPPYISSSQYSVVYKRWHDEQLLTTSYYLKSSKVHQDGDIERECYWFHISDIQKMLKVRQKVKASSPAFQTPNNLTLLIQHVSNSVVVMENHLCVFEKELKIPCDIDRNPYMPYTFSNVLCNIDISSQILAK